MACSYISALCRQINIKAQVEDEISDAKMLGCIVGLYENEKCNN